VEGSVPDQELEVGGVLVIGLGNLPGRVARHASQMYGSNLLAFVEHFWSKEAGRLVLNREDEILAGSLVCHGGAIISERLKG
jgi:H+-translocating NAD(P) transhydrogenase subunit alpha